MTGRKTALLAGGKLQISGMYEAGKLVSETPNYRL
jgi:hypothetical protein